MSTITKKELIDRIAERTQAKRVLVKATVQSFIDALIAELAKGNRLEFRDFGVVGSQRWSDYTAFASQTPVLDGVQDCGIPKVLLKQYTFVCENLSIGCCA
jgi:hypothetical protein